MVQMVQMKGVVVQMKKSICTRLSPRFAVRFRLLVHLVHYICN